MDKEQLQKIIKEFTRGSKGAFNKLFKLYQKAIKGYVYSHCFGSLKQKADDIIQETWIIIWEKHEQFDTSRSFYSFVCYWAGIMIKRHISRVAEHVSLDEENFNEGELVTASASSENRMSDEMELLFKITLTKGGPPHQLLAFAFNKLLPQWKPRRIVDDLANLTLQELMNILIKDYTTVSCLPEGLVTYLFWPLSAVMSVKVGQVLEDEISRNTYSHLLNQTTGETLLSDYFSQDAVHNISDWTYKVRTRITKYFSKNNEQPRDKIHLKNVS